MSAEEEKEVDSKTPAEHALLVQRVYKRLKNELNNATPDYLDDEDVIKLRRRLVYECEKAMSDSLFRQDIFEKLWLHGFYSTVYVYRSTNRMNNGLTTSEKKKLEEFVKKSKGYFLKLKDIYPDLEYQIYMCIGDLYRYCADMNLHELNVQNSIKYYTKALCIKPDNGHPLNQIGVLYKQKNPWKSSIMFIKAYLSNESYQKAEENFNLLKETGFTNDLNEATWDYVYGMFESFNRIEFNDLKTNWFKQLQKLLEEDNVDYFKVLDSFYFILLGSILALRIDQDNKEKLRYLLHSICEDIKFLLKEITDNYIKAPIEKRFQNRIKEIRANRRQRRRNESESEDDEDAYKLFSDDEDEAFEDEKDEENFENNSEESENKVDVMLPYICMCIEWFNYVDIIVKKQKLSVGLRMDLQTIIQQMVEIINKYVDDITDYVGNKSSVKVVWLLKSPGMKLPEKFFYRLIAKLMESAEEWLLCPVYFDLYYKFLSKNQDLKAMKAMAELRLAFESIESHTDEIPKYILFEAEAIRSKLHILKSIIKSKQSHVLVTKSTMRKFDLNKAKDADVRSAIRFLEEATKNNDVTLIQSNENRSSNIAREFLKSLDDTEDENLIILCGDRKEKLELETINSHKLYLESVDRFFEKFISKKRGGMFK